MIYDNAVFDYLRLFAPKSPDFHIACVPEGINIFPTLDDVDCQFEKMYANTCRSGSFIQDLAQSKHSKTIKVLDLTNMLLKSPDILKHFTALTTFCLIILKGSDIPDTVNTTDFLNVLPKTVTTFKVKCPSLTCVLFNTRVSFIDILEINCDLYLAKELGDIITPCFPKLVELELSGKLSGNVDIVLNNDSMKRLFIFDMKGHYGISFKSGIQADPQHYLCEYNYITASKYDDIKGLPNIYFTSFKEKDLKIQDYIDIFSLKASIQSF